MRPQLAGLLSSILTYMRSCGYGTQPELCGELATSERHIGESCNQGCENSIECLHSGREHAVHWRRFCCCGVKLFHQYDIFVVLMYHLLMFMASSDRDNHHFSKSSEFFCSRSETALSLFLGCGYTFRNCKRTSFKHLEQPSDSSSEALGKPLGIRVW